MKYNDPKLKLFKHDFNNLENHKEDIKGDDCFFCIGTTKKNSPDKNEYRRVELDSSKTNCSNCKIKLSKFFCF